MKQIKLYLTLALLALGIGQVWANQTDLISGVTLPDIPSTSLDMATQTFKTPDANGWIVMEPNGDIRNANVTWFTAMAWNTSSQTISNVSSYTAPFVTLNSVSVTTVQQTARTKAIRFTGATDISFLASSGGSRTVYVSLYSYDGANQVLIETKSAGNTWTEFLFSSLTPSTTYVAYMYESTNSNGYIAEIAIKAHTCDDPSATFTVNSGSSASIYTTGTATLAFSSSNESAVVYSVTKDAVAATANTDYSIAEGVFTPLAGAGEYVITATQAEDGTHCEVDESVTVTVNVATPVTSASISGTSPVNQGTSVTLTCDAANATEWQWQLAGEDINGAIASTYTFTASTPGTFSYTVKARNSFNSGSWITSTAFSLKVNAVVDKVIYSWEGAEGGATEVGGTASSSASPASKCNVNYLNSGYYTLQLADKADYSGEYIKIDLNNNMIAGDKVAITAYYTKSESKTVAVKIADGNNSNATILTGSNLPNIYNDAATPATETLTVPAGISTNKLHLTRSTTSTTAFVTKLVITRTLGLSSEAYQGVKVNGTTVTATVEGNVVTVTGTSCVSVPTVTLIKRQTYSDESTADVDVAVSNMALNAGGDFFEGTAKIGETTYTVKVPVDSTVYYTVSYYNGETLLGSEEVAENGHPAEYATYQTLTHYTFAGWYNNSDLADGHAVANMATETITGATSYYSKWTENAKMVVTFMNNGVQYGDVQNIYVEDNKKVAAVDSPVKAGNVFKGWYNGETKYDFSTVIAAAGTLTLTATWEAIDQNHYEYAYNDDFHYDGVSYHTPEGKVDAANGASNVPLTNTAYTLFSGTGITSVVANNAIYDSKDNWVNSYLKLNTSATSNLVITIASGYTATLKMKMGGYSANPTVTLKDSGDTEVDATEGTIDGVASKENNYNEITYSLTAGTYTMTTTGKTLYISHIDLVAEVYNPTSLTDLENGAQPKKVIENGVLYILRDGKTYNAQGMQVK